jgi:hypothetical protein
MATKQLLFRKNRASIPVAELAKHRGQWIAFSSDGCTILAGAPSIAELEEQLISLGQNPQQVALEYVPGPEEDINIGGAETV